LKQKINGGVYLQENSQYQLMNNQAYNQPNILQLRLDTSEILENFKIFLSGDVLVPERAEDGGTVYIRKSIGKPICNQKGVQQLINYISGLINPSVVQGNYTFEQYENHLNRIHKTITRQLLVNYHDWNMQYADLELVNDVVLNIMETFLSRLIDNKERDSYATTLKSNETSRVDTGGKLLNLFGGGANRV
jgi:hypothetical protein